MLFNIRSNQNLQFTMNIGHVSFSYAVILAGVYIHHRIRDIMGGGRDETVEEKIMKGN